jgi:hypothetical protein
MPKRITHHKAHSHTVRKISPTKKKEDFSEADKLKAKEAACFKCCVCRVDPCFEIHHLEPLGGNGLDNAIPLCPRCHDLYGDDPKRKKFLRQARDYWFRVNKKSPAVIMEMNKSILEVVERIEENVITREEAIQIISETAIQTQERLSEKINEELKIRDLQGIINTVASMVTSDNYSNRQQAKITGETYMVVCSICGTIYDNQTFKTQKIKCDNCGGVLE